MCSLFTFFIFIAHVSDSRSGALLISDFVILFLRFLFIAFISNTLLLLETIFVIPLSLCGQKYIIIIIVIIIIIISD